jgi:hydroxymethylglutaryl-CoA synthase
MLVGPGAPIVVHSTARVSHFRHAYDFYKAEMCSEYPTVDGSLSINCYFEAIEVNYSRYVAKQRHLSASAESHRDVSCSGSPLDWIADFYCFHSPFTKLVRKSFARMLHSDFKVDPNCFKFEGVQESADRDKTFLALSEKQFCEKVEPSLLLAKELGNTYTASLYCGLISLIAARGRNLCGKKACMFSYGSGFASSMFPIEFCDPEAQVYRHFEGLAKELEHRLVLSPEVFVDTLKKREEAHGMAPYRPTGSVDDLASGSYYLEAVDEKRRRTYCLKQ